MPPRAGPSPSRATPIHQNVGARHVARRVRKQEDDGGFVLVLARHPAERDQVAQPRHKGVVLLRIHAARRQRVNANVSIRPIGCEIAGKPQATPI